MVFSFCSLQNEPSCSCLCQVAADYQCKTWFVEQPGGEQAATGRWWGCFLGARQGDGFCSRLAVICKEILYFFGWWRRLQLWEFPGLGRMGCACRFVGCWFFLFCFVLFSRRKHRREKELTFIKNAKFRACPLVLWWGFCEVRGIWVPVDAWNYGLLF